MTLRKAPKAKPKRPTGRETFFEGRVRRHRFTGDNPKACTKCKQRYSSVVHI
jgi:hypothetical protein